MPLFIIELGLVKVPQILRQHLDMIEIILLTGILNLYSINPSYPELCIPTVFNLKSLSHILWTVKALKKGIRFYFGDIMCGITVTTL